MGYLLVQLVQSNFGCWFTIVADNGLTGEIPSTIGRLTNLGNFNFGRSCRGWATNKALVVPHLFSSRSRFHVHARAKQVHEYSSGDWSSNQCQRGFHLYVPIFRLDGFWPAKYEASLISRYRSSFQTKINFEEGFQNPSETWLYSHPCIYVRHVVIFHHATFREWTWAHKFYPSTFRRWERIDWHYTDGDCKLDVSIQRPFE